MTKPTSNNQQPTSKSPAFTLIEILVSALILAVAIPLTFSAFYSTTQFQRKTDVLRETTQTARFFIETLSREVRLADKIEVKDTAGQILWLTKDGATKKYGYALDGRIVLINGAQSTNITPDNLYTGVKYTALGADGLSIELKVKDKNKLQTADQGTVVLRTKVYKRRYNQK